MDIKIIANKETAGEELQFLRSFADTSGLQTAKIDNSGGSSNTGADVAPEIIIVLKFSALAIATGLLAAIGEDVWKYLKKFMKDVFRYYNDQISGSDDTFWFYNVYLVMNFVIDGKLLLQIQFPRKNISEFKASLEKIRAFLNKRQGSKFIALVYKDGEWEPTKEKFLNHEEKRKASERA